MHIAAYRAQGWQMVTNKNDIPDCDCLTAGPRTPIHVIYLGRDTTGGRYADVEIRRCPDCGRSWLHYHVEYAAFVGSGRWCEGIIDESHIATMTPEDAPGYLASLAWHVFGGSYYSHAGRRGSGKLRWDR
jgi:hypothetical protein